MAGLNLRVGGFGGVGTGAGPSYSGDPAGVSSVTQAAFGPGASVPMESTGSILTPNDGFGTAFCAGVIAVGLLVLIRRSLPR